ncbi:Sua5/YciO/YrdC/YwlC family protein [Thiomicrospira sp. ALE5]|uniref:Sua5/YciO/YrdC/YwlC family protein n=1 Tax=Thiomicrospira sp. ALE5 TaxID=748650 RepID=UPI0008E3E5D3|nr:Sua5/YciO/YrdC/YwlC family protein [Thiomicrospira sp. ALE5]SFR56660.1 L-threonylcarbamoyladenylate synthase [Thiomicrospira sp. ALE5]
MSASVFAYPTEAVYGLGCDPLDQTAVYQILKLKQRPVEKGLILVAADINALAKFADVLNPQWFDRLQQAWSDTQRAVTWVVPKTQACPDWISGQHNSVAVRVSHHPLVKQLAQTMPDSVMVSTSANPASLEPARSAAEVKHYFGEALYCVEGELGGLAQPSEIWDAQTFTRIR